MGTLPQPLNETVMCKDHLQAPSSCWLNHILVHLLVF